MAIEFFNVGTETLCFAFAWLKSAMKQHEEILLVESTMHLSKVGYPCLKSNEQQTANNRSVNFSLTQKHSNQTKTKYCIML